MPFLRNLVKVLPTLGFAFVLAVAVWVNAETARDPNLRRIYPRALTVQIIGQDPNVVLVGDAPRTVTVEINAPQSVWNQDLTFDEEPVTANVNLSGLGPGTHTVEVNVNIRLRAAEITAVTPSHLTINLEPLATRSVPVQLVRLGEPAIGFQAEDPTLKQDMVTISGPQSQVELVEEVRASLNLGDAHETIQSSVALQPLDGDENIVEGVSISPDKIEVTQPITQRGGYRNVVVNIVTEGEIAHGYRLTNLSVFPPAVVVFSVNPERVNDLPGYVDTQAVNLEGATDDLDIRVPLDLPEGVSVVGDQNVLVRVGIAAIESSLTVSNLPVEFIGLGPGLQARTVLETVEVIVSGPLPLLDELTPEDILVQIDLTGMGIGTYPANPIIEVNSAQLRVTTVLPAELEVVIEPALASTPTRRP